MIERVDGLLGGCNHSGVAASDVERPGRGEAVEEAAAVDVLDPGAGPLGLDDVEPCCLEDPDLLGIEVAPEGLENPSALCVGHVGIDSVAHSRSVGRCRDPLAWSSWDRH